MMIDESFLFQMMLWQCGARKKKRKWSKGGFHLKIVDEKKRERESKMNWNHSELRKNEDSTNVSVEIERKGK